MTKNTRPTVAITGASGFLGSKLVQYFLAKKWKVIGLVRNPEGQKTQKDLEWRVYDLSKRPTPSTLKGADYLIHAAYIKLTSENPDALEVNVSGAKNIITSAQEAHIKQMVFISTMSAHEDAISIYGKQKFIIEKEFLKTKQATVLRCGLIIGAGGIVNEMAQFMRTKHAVPLIGGGRQPLQIISVYDLVEVIYKVIDKGLLGRLVAATPTVYEYRDFYRALAQELDVRVAYIPISYKSLEAIFKIASALHIRLGVGEDNLKGLKMLKSMPSEYDMKKIDVQLIDLKSALRKSKLRA